MIILAESIEEIGELLSKSEQDAINENIAKSGEKNLTKATIKRASMIIESASTKNSIINNISNSSSTWLLCLFLFLILAFSLGLITNRFGFGNYINILALPPIATALWNIFIYFTLLTKFAWNIINPQKIHKGNITDSLNCFIYDKIESLHTWNHKKISNRGYVEKLFHEKWKEKVLPYQSTATNALLCLAAILFAAGIITGMYWNGLMTEYRAVWESTFLNADEVQDFVNFTFGPASFLSGIEIPNVSTLQISDGNGEGGNAETWIHFYSITLAMIVCLPRLAIGIYSYVKIKRKSDSIQCNPLYINKTKKLLDNSYRDNRVFKVSPHPPTINGITNLSTEETILLFSIQYYLTSKDITATEVNNKLYEHKKRWRINWRKNIQSVEIDENNISNQIVTDEATFQRGIKELKNGPLSNEKKLVLLFEAAVFRPYFNLTENQNELKAKPKDVDSESFNKHLVHISKQLGVNYHDVEQMVNRYSEAESKIKGGTLPTLVPVLLATLAMALTAGAAAPAIGGIIGGFLGLSGAAATSAGLAMLGGGAIAAGGMGVAGGTMVIIGGGALLGAGGAGIGNSILRSSKDGIEIIVNQLAKLEAISRVVIPRLHNPSNEISKIVNQANKQLRDLESIHNSSANRKERSNIKKSMQCYERAISRLNKINSH